MADLAGLAARAVAQAICERWFNGYDVSRDDESIADIALHALTAAGYRIIGPGSVDDIASAMWREEAIESGTPSSVAAVRTREAFDEQADQLKDRWRKLANSALRALQSQEAGNEH